MSENQKSSPWEAVNSGLSPSEKEVIERSVDRTEEKRKGKEQEDKKRQKYKNEIQTYEKLSERRLQIEAETTRLTSQLKALETGRDHIDTVLVPLKEFLKSKGLIGKTESQK